jgi:hypothetical protein
MAGRSLNISLVATLTPLEKSLVAVGKMMTDFAQSIASTDAKLADSIRSSVDTMNTELAKVKQSFDNVGKNGDDAGKKAGGSLRTQLRQATAEAQRLAESVGTSDPRFLAAAKKAAMLKDSIEDTQLAINAMNPDEKFKGVAALMGGIMGVAAGIQGAMTAFGVESEDAQQAVAKLQGMMAMAQGLNALGGLSDAMGAVKTQVLEATKGMSNLKTALIGTGIGAAIIAVGLLAANWDKVSDSLMGTSDKTRAYKDSQEEVNKSVSDSQAKFYEANNAITAYKEGVISKKEALEIYNKTVGDSIGKTNDIRVAELLISNNTSIFLKSIELKTRAQVLYAKAAEQSAKIASGESAEVGFWEQVGNAVLSAGNMYDLASRNAETSGKKIAESQKEVTNLTNLANEEMKKALSLEKKLGDVKGNNKKFEEKNKPKDKKDNEDKDAKANAKALKDYEDNKEAGMQYLKQTLDTQKKLEDDAQKSYEENLEAGMQYHKQIIDQKLQSVKDNQQKELDLITKFGKDKQEIEEEFAKIKAENPLFNDKEIYDQMATNFENAASRMVNAGQLIQQAFANLAVNGIELLATTIGELMEGGGSLESFFDSFTSMVADAAVSLGKQFVQMGIAAYVIQTQLFINPPAAIAAGAALIAIGSMAKASMANLGKEETTGFAAGGVVYGPTNALIGEYSGASNNPEVVAPLDKLQGILMRSMGGGGGGNVMVQGVISGNNIRISQTKNSRDYSRITGRETRF